MRLTVILFVLTSSAGLLCDVITTSAPKTVSDFVDLLKIDLRRNNDDYVESTTLSVRVPNPYLHETSTHASNDTRTNLTFAKQGTFHYQREPTNYNKLLNNTKNITVPHRRVFDSLEGESAGVKNEATTKSASPTPISLTPINKIRNITLKVTKTLPESTTIKMLNILKFNRSGLNAVASFRGSHKKDSKNTEKRNKIKNFITRNKQLFEEFVNKKRLEANKTTKAPMQQQPPGKAEYDSELTDEQDGLLRAREPPPQPASLHPDQLDMAPAKGGQIHALRIKNRLCYRHVLVPEGPKYDSRGAVYLGAYGHGAGRDYRRTRRPRHVLPRCCNCCKKSLLGCQ